MDRDIIKELSKWLDNYRAFVENHVGCDIYMYYDKTENAAKELYIKHIKPYQNQKAIECLKEVRKFVDGRTYLAEWIDNKIKELEEEK